MALSTKNFVAQIQFTRPADTTQYSVGDAISDDATTATVATFTLKGMSSRSNGGGKIKSVVLHKTDQDLTGADFDVYFFDTAPVGTNFEDNAAVALTDAEMQTCVGFVQLTAASDGVSMGTGDLYNKTNLDLPYECKGNTTNLYAVVVARGTYTPASAEVFTIRVGCEVN